MPRGGRRSTSFKPGQSGNPGGKPKLPPPVRQALADAKALARPLAPEAIQTLSDVMTNAKAPPAARVGAAIAILDRGYGKPAQAVEAKLTIVDRMTDAEQRTLLEALDALDDDAGEPQA
jgi:hypothetical protein